MSECPPVIRLRPSAYDVVLCDLDSTLADTRHRRELCPTIDPDRTWTDFAMACADDAPIAGTVRVLQLFDIAGYGIHIVSYRDPAAHELTETWLKQHDVPWDRLTLGADKLVYLTALRESGYRPLLFIEDWPDLAANIEAAGVPVLCVNPRYNEYRAHP